MSEGEKFILRIDRVIKYMTAVACIGSQVRGQLGNFLLEEIRTHQLTSPPQH